MGRCRKHAPTMGGYPVVFETDWCGDHKLDETKIGPDGASKDVIDPWRYRTTGMKCWTCMWYVKKVLP